MFGKLGAVTIDADTIVSGLLLEPDVLDSIRKALGSEVFSEDGRLDREKVAALVFSNRESREVLEGILHPLVFVRIEHVLSGEAGEGEPHKVAVVEIPLLFEKRYERRFRKRITVHTDKDTVLRRLQAKGITKEDVLRRLEAQMPIAEKIALSDFAIDNAGSPEETERQVEEIYITLLKEVE